MGVRFVRWFLEPSVVAGLLLVVGIGSFGDTPDTRDSSATTAAWYVAHRADVLTGVVVTGLGLVALLWFAGTVTDRLSPRGHAGAGQLAGRATSVAVTVLAGGLLLVHAGLAYVIGAEAPGSAKALFELTLVTTPIVAPFLAVPGVGFAARGPLSPDVGQQVVFQVLVLWLLAAGVAWPVRPARAPRRPAAGSPALARS